ncbi:helix-turn-helix domain-containing protein [Actinoallomurus sp. NPDC052274]|uniref:helix-turn-helix transcriptional regulator n=1 Tax=Actinoallomurus sp. NPDC052274 TaxID=3155420 RepID=UPI00341DCA47
MTALAPAHPRAADRLLLIEEIAERLRRSEQSVRYLRHRGELPFLFRDGRRLVAWESDVLSYLERLQEAEKAARQETAG